MEEENARSLVAVLHAPSTLKPFTAYMTKESFQQREPMQSCF
jgi:hypothetical protein